jgi:hypothetical protein
MATLPPAGVVIVGPCAMIQRGSAAPSLHDSTSVRATVVKMTLSLEDELAVIDWAWASESASVGAAS